MSQSDDRAEIAAQKNNWPEFFAYFDKIQNEQHKSALAGRLLHSAIDQSNFKAVKRLVDNKPKMSHVKDGKTPIQRASDHGRWDCVEVIANVVKTDDDDTAKYSYALLKAAKKDQTDAAIALVNAGAPIIWGSQGYSAIDYSIISSRVDHRWLLLAILENHGETAANSEHKWGISPLSRALDENNEKAVKLLIQYGACLTESSDDMAEIAAQKKNWPVFFAYFDKIQNEQHKSTLAGRLLHSAIDQNYFKAVKQLVDNKPMMSHVKDGKTPIQRASDHGRWDHVEVIANVVKTDDVDTAKYSYALLKAAKKDETGAAIALVNAGAPITWDSQGYSAIDYSIIGGQWYHLSLLLAILENHGETAANSEHKWGISPLSRALDENNEKAVKLLTQYGACLTKSNDSPRTSFWKAVSVSRHRSQRSQTTPSALLDDESDSPRTSFWKAVSVFSHRLQRSPKTSSALLDDERDSPKLPSVEEFLQSRGL